MFRKSVGIKLFFVLALLALSAGAVFGQTPEPPPTIEEMTTSVTAIVAGVAIVIVMVAVSFAFGSATRFIRGLVRSGR